MYVKYRFKYELRDVPIFIPIKIICYSKFRRSDCGLQFVN